MQTSKLLYAYLIYRPWYYRVKPWFTSEVATVALLLGVGILAMLVVAGLCALSWLLF